MAIPFKLSKASNIAIHALSYMAITNEYLSANWLGKELNLSSNHITKVLNKLVAKGYLESTRGNKGGFRIKVKPERITLLNIIEAIEGEINEVICLLEKDICQQPKCILLEINREVAKLVKEKLGNVTLKDFIQQTSFKIKNQYN